MNQSRTLKVNFNDDCRRVALVDTSFASLQKQVSQLFNLQEGSFVLKYKDDEGDLVTVSSEMEFKEALNCFQNMVRFTVYESNKGNNNTNNNNNNKEWKGRCGRKMWKKWKCRSEQNNEEPNQHGHHHHHHRHHHQGNPFAFFNNIKDIANQFVQGGQCDNLIEGFLNSGFVKLEHNHLCDGCDAQISGTRYHCTTCQDFDFCSNCYEQKIDSHDSTHKFDKISALDALKEALKNGEQIDSFFMPGKSTDPVEKKVHHAFCDRCNQTIVGIRHKCLECPDFDFCNSCFVTAAGKETFKGHHKEHPFGKIENPGDLESFNQQKLLHQQKLEQLKNETIVSPPLVEQPKIEEPKIEQPKVEEPKSEQPKEQYPFSKKLEDLFTMGFSDRKRNISLLIKNKGDIQLTIQDLLN